MESHSRLVKRPHRSLWLCNELVWEFCSAIPIVNTWERILLTSTNIHTYLGPRFRKMLIYRDAIAFIKARLNANKNFDIQIDVNQNKESEPIINQELRDSIFVLQTNHFGVQIWYQVYSSNELHISDKDAQFEYAHLYYFLRLIAPLVRPIHLDFSMSSKPIEHLKRFLNALSGCIDSIGLTVEQFNSTLADGALAKYNNKLEMCAYDPVNAAKLVHWLTTPNNNSNTIGQSKKYLTYLCNRIDDAIPLLDEIKKDFALSTSKCRCRFVVRLELEEQLDEFILRNELTGEKLELHLKNIEDGCFTYALSRFPNNEMNNIEGDFAEFDPYKITTILF